MSARRPIASARQRSRIEVAGQNLHTTFRIYRLRCNILLQSCNEGHAEDLEGNGQRECHRQAALSQRHPVQHRRTAFI
jgi:hypothetical protein